MSIEAANEPVTVQFQGMGTVTLPVLTTGYKNIKGKLTLPSINGGDPANSQVIITVNINGESAIYTGQAGARSFESGAYATAGQVFNVILSSSLPGDQALEAGVSSTISFY